MGLHAAVASLTRPVGAAKLTGAAPTADGDPLHPEDAWGHDHLWFLDRMVRSSQPLMERMTLIWHDWFATSIAEASQRHMLDQNEMFRRNALGSFASMVVNVTTDPAMIRWLNQDQNTRWDPNENYARELMELFTLGADRGAYTEDDVRELARALTGWNSDWSPELGHHNFRFVADRHDPGTKTVFGQRGTFGWRDACAMCIGHRLHPSFFVEKLWSYFIPVPPSASDRAALEMTYVAGGHAVRPVVEAILLHPHLLKGPRMVKPPAVYVAGMLRQQRRAVDTPAWVWLGEGMGQRLFYPPNVAGWNDEKWLDTSTLRGRWSAVAEMLNGRHIRDGAMEDYPDDESPEQAVLKARAFWGDPAMTADGLAALQRFAATCLPAVDGQLAEAPVQGHPPERASAPDRHLPRPADELESPMTPSQPNPESAAPAEVAACGCADLSRAKLLRGAASAAVPGRGLPAIERGMPTPAGTGLTRRSFISRTAGMAMAVYGASALGWEAFDEGIAAAAQRPAEPVLVSVFLEGGIDSLSVLAPTGHSRYAQLRPSLALGAGEGTPFAEDPSLRWHPSAAALDTLHGEGKVTVFPAIGYTGANQSHFTSRHYWEVGETNPNARLGWMGRYLDRHGAPDNPLQGLSLGWDLSPSLAAGNVPVATMSRPDDYGFWSPGVWGPVEPTGC